MLFGDGRKHFNIFFLKIEKLSEFFILWSRLFHSVTMDEKYEFLKNVCLTLNWVILSMFLVLCALLTVGILLNRYLVDWLLFSLKNSKVSYTIAAVVRIPNLILDNFPRGTSYSACYNQHCVIMYDVIFWRGKMFCSFRNNPIVLLTLAYF